MVAVPIATGRTPAELRALARRERDGRVSARLLALANALDGMSRDEAARAAGMDRQTVRNWVHRYNAEGYRGPAGSAPSRPALRLGRGPVGRTQGHDPQRSQARTRRLCRLARP